MTWLPPLLSGFFAGLSWYFAWQARKRARLATAALLEVVKLGQITGLLTRHNVTLSRSLSERFGEELVEVELPEGAWMQDGGEA